MKLNGLILNLLGLLVSCNGSIFQFLSSEVFILPLTHFNFSLPSADVKYRSSLLNMPDLPFWLHYTYSSAVQSGFIYGAPPEDVSNIKLEVIATDKQTYNTSRRVYDVNIVKQTAKPNEVRFKITNLNIDELIIEARWERLRSVLVEDLWPESTEDGVVTSLLPATHKGDRLPLLPEDKEGVYVSFGSSASFSFALLDLEMEVKPLWEHRPCPKYFKKASYERFFRQKGFAIDWCNFKLFTTAGNEGPKSDPRQRDFISSLELPFQLVKKSEVTVRSYVFDMIYTIVIPLLVMLALLGLLSLAMCCHRTNIMPTTRDIQMVHYAGVHRALGAMRTLRMHEGRDYSPHNSTATTTTNVDPLPRSRTASPSSTLPRGSATPSRRFEDLATLNRPNPPPYQRNGSMRRHKQNFDGEDSSTQEDYNQYEDYITRADYNRYEDYNTQEDYDTQDGFNRQIE